MGMIRVPQRCSPRRIASKAIWHLESTNIDNDDFHRQYLRGTKTRFSFVMFGKHGSALATINRFDDVWFLNHRLRLGPNEERLSPGRKDVMDQALVAEEGASRGNVSLYVDVVKNGLENPYPVHEYVNVLAQGLCWSTKAT
ncbi:hypothetical protein U1Q18_002396 [Sarracenia purpurea var. burkii]